VSSVIAKTDTNDNSLIVAENELTRGGITTRNAWGMMIGTIGDSKTGAYPQD